MGALASIGLGFETALQPYNLLFTGLGVILGLVIGVLPGLGGTAGVAILLPITIFMPPNAALMFLAGIYWGSAFGGVVTSILFGIPGEPWSVATMFDGYPLTRQGKGGTALTAAFLVSLFSAILSAALFTFLAQPFAGMALKFGAPELFAVLLITFGTFIGMGGKSPFRTLIMMTLGFLMASVGLDIVTGQPRLTFGSVTLLEGIDFVPVTIGLFGIGEILASATEQGDGSTQKAASRLGLADVVESLRSIGRNWLLAVWSSLLGFWVGILPGLGATPASFMAYGLARKTARNQEEFGRGAIQGVLAPESANKSAAIGSILPMITLGVPGSPTAAVIMAGLYTWGLLPGPTLFEQKPDLVWGFIASLYVANAFAFLVCLFATPALTAIMRVPYALLTPMIVIFSMLGAYAISNSLFHVWLVLLFGVVGFVLRRLGYPVAPLVVALVLGAPTETALRQTLILGNGSPAILFARPLAAPLTVIGLALFLLPAVQALVRLGRRGPGRGESRSEVVARAG